MSNKDLIRQVKLSCADPRKLATALELVDGASQKQARGIIVRCPAHDDGARASCSIILGKDGTAQVKCHACGFCGDALSLIACVYGLDLKQDFKRVLIMGAEIGGNNGLVAELEDGKPRPDRIHIPEPRQLEEAPWPEGVQNFWDSCSQLHTDQEACSLFESRGIDPARAEGLGLARVLPAGRLPKWAKYGRRDWRKTSNRIIVRSWDSDGILRSVRAWRVTAGDSPKRLPPVGCKSAGLVLADRRGHAVLRGENAAHTLWIVEGEPDWMAATIAAPGGGHAVWGVGSGSWTSEAATKASQVRRVIVATHADDAGDRYAAQILSSVKKSVRYRPTGDLDEQRGELTGLMGAASKWLFVPHILGD